MNFVFLAEKSIFCLIFTHRRSENRILMRILDPRVGTMGTYLLSGLALTFLNATSFLAAIAEIRPIRETSRQILVVC